MNEQPTNDQPTREERARAALAGRTRRQVSLAQPNTSVPVSYNSIQTEQENTATALPQRDSVINQSLTTPAELHVVATEIQQHDAVFPQQFSREAPLQDDIATEVQSSAALMQSSGVELASSVNTTIEQQHTIAKPPQDTVTEISSNNDEAVLGSSTTADLHRDNAISRYRDEEREQQSFTNTEVQENISSAQSGIPTVEPESSDITSLQSRNVVAPQSAAQLKQREDDTMTEQRIVTETVQPDNEALLQGDEAAALESMLASVPEDAVAQLMQALLVQPRVNKLNAAAWRSGGMQVTHGTHKSYKLLAGQYGVHMRDIVEQTLKACLPIWRARLKQLREEGVLGEEEAEEELND